MAKLLLSSPSLSHHCLQQCPQGLLLSCTQTPPHFNHSLHFPEKDEIFLLCKALGGCFVPKVSFFLLAVTSMFALQVRFSILFC